MVSRGQAATAIILTVVGCLVVTWIAVSEASFAGSVCSGPNGGCTYGLNGPTVSIIALGLLITIAGAGVLFKFLYDTKP